MIKKINIDELIIAIDEYINYYNYNKIKVKLKGLSPVNYRLQSSNQKLFINCPTFWGSVLFYVSNFILSVQNNSAF